MGSFRASRSAIQQRKGIFMAIGDMPTNKVLEDAERARSAAQTEGVSEPASRSQTATSSDRENMPPLVQTWPRWLQEQWQATQGQPARATRGSWVIWLASPLGAMALALILIVGLVGFGVGSALNGAGNSTASASSSSSSSSTMTMGSASGSTSANTAHVPNATEDYGNQLAKYTVDADGAKHFTFTAKQVMWSPLKGVRVLAWTLDGTVPGPMIRVTAGNHVRITIVNHFPEATAIHWHGLEVPMDADGVPTLGMKAIQPNTKYTYDFVVQDQDAGTHWYHSHYDDMTQVGGGLYGAFIVDPRPGSPEAQKAIHADVEYTAFVSHLGAYWTINGKSFPDTEPWLVKHGQTVRIRLIGADPSMMHPMHLHGHTFTIVAEDGHLLAPPIQKDTVQLGPGETYDLTFTAWGKKGDIYPFHCHILTHVMNPGQTGAEMGGLIVAVEYTA
jgi:FtsP/CotA-like multicopper oxidase with cupredoxin domain